ncbi:hypothetical protein CEXT_171131 [Caerostris extrusa]|uniref:Uncharacterized protein n=1 Tax=Caerostris extrusa TaxID=172846 RepID=A0AAV4NWP8_CAEEX|nr:hypothetical protein CEXT_171131 [Caerostris extrusa]
MTLRIDVQCLNDADYEKVPDSTGQDAQCFNDDPISKVTFFVYWIAGLCYTLIDLTGRPEFLLKYRIQETSSYPVSFSKC